MRINFKSRYMWIPLGMLPAICAFGAAHAQAVHSRTIPPAEQAARDADRIRILQDELGKQQVGVAELAKRRADRLAARDGPGLQEVEAAQRRANADLSALRRELELATKASHGTGAGPAPAASVTADRQPESPSRSVGAPGPWWDVYSNPPRNDPETRSQRATVAGQPVHLVSDQGGPSMASRIHRNSGARPAVPPFQSEGAAP